MKEIPSSATTASTRSLTAVSGSHRPSVARPERWREQAPTAYDFVPQGGGDVRTGHRCPGEGISTTVVSVTLECLARHAFTVETPTVDLERIPTLPSDGLRVTSFSH